jgi:hydrogenase expression/formation protein HypE
VDTDGDAIQGRSCPLPLPAGDRILLGHGSGGRLSEALIRNLFLPALRNPALARLDDSAVVGVGGLRLAFTTDSFVLDPLFLPGGDIGSLAVHGTVNDLAMGGAQPLCLSAAFIIEEGLPMETLRRVVESMRRAAAEVGVDVVTGDTKVVEKGSADQLFITTSGIGLVPEGVHISADQARPGDRILLSGSIGEHGIAVLAQREGLDLEGEIETDSAPLHGLVSEILETGGTVHCLRDPTRGGIASALNELARSSGVGMTIEERAIPVREEVRGACELLGLDPLHVANEGKLVAIVEASAAEQVLAAMRRHPLGRQAEVIGAVEASDPGVVKMRTAIGTTRLVDMLAGDQLPRIC